MYKHVYTYIYICVTGTVGRLLQVNQIMASHHCCRSTLRRLIVDRDSEIQTDHSVVCPKQEQQPGDLASHAESSFDVESWAGSPVVRLSCTVGA